MRTWRKLHKWLGLLVFIQVLLWTGSGLVISLVDAGEARGAGTLERQPPLSLPQDRYLPIAELPLSGEGLDSVVLTVVDGEAVYRVSDGNGVRLLRASTGQPREIDADAARRIARASYRGEAQIENLALEENPPALPGFEGRAWRIRFGDALATDAYVDADSGRLLAHRNSRSALVEFMLKLHFMDYDGGHNFNHPLIIFAGFCALWLALSGALLLVQSLRRVGLR